MLRLWSLTKYAFALSVALAVLWGLLACASLCTLESSLHDSQASTCGPIGDESVDGVEPMEDYCLCPDISSTAATTPQRETGEQIVSLGSATSRFDLDIGSIPIFSDRTSDLPDDSPPKINAPPLFLRLRALRI